MSLKMNSWHGKIETYKHLYLFICLLPTYLLTYIWKERNNCQVTSEIKLCTFIFPSLYQCFSLIWFFDSRYWKSEKSLYYVKWKIRTINNSPDIFPLISYPWFPVEGSLNQHILLSVGMHGLFLFKDFTAAASVFSIFWFILQFEVDKVLCTLSPKSTKLTLSSRRWYWSLWVQNHLEKQAVTSRLLSLWDGERGEGRKYVDS